MTTRTNEIDEIRISRNTTHESTWDFMLTFSDGSSESGTVKCDGQCWEAIDELIDQCDEDYGVWSNPVLLEQEWIDQEVRTAKEVEIYPVPWSSEWKLTVLTETARLVTRVSRDGDEGPGGMIDRVLSSHPLVCKLGISVSDLKYEVRNGNGCYVYDFA